jgi:hypothetical protein
VALGACTRVLGIEETLIPDAAPDGLHRACYGSSDAPLRPCFDDVPSRVYIFDNTQTIDTGSPEQCLSEFPNACVIAGSTVMIVRTSQTFDDLEITGARPLVLVARTIFVSGAIRVVASGSECVGATAPTGLGGAAGGSYGSPGGKGGNGGSPTAGLGGTAATATSFAGLRRGCAGQTSLGGGLGGKGGGVLYLIASERISIGPYGSLLAGGEGAPVTAPISKGGGGGGSGGLVILDAPVIENLGIVSTPGGGGAEGSANSFTGAAGADATITSGGDGGKGTTSGGGDGGDGAGFGVAAAAAGGPGTSGFPGGGGGGGHGIIKIYGAVSGSGGFSQAPK